MNGQFDKTPKPGSNKESIPPVYEVDLSEGYDTQAQLELFERELKKLPFYNSELLYSGFNASHIGKSSSSKEGEGVVFCADEKYMFDYENPGFTSRSPFAYAGRYPKPAIAVYDSSKMEDVVPGLSYKLKSPDAIIAIIRLKF